MSFSSAKGDAFENMGSILLISLKPQCLTLPLTQASDKS